MRRQKVQEESDSGGSEETQEYVQEAKSMEYEEEEERTFVPSAVSVPLNLDGKSLQEEQKGKHPRRWKRSKGVDWTEMRKEKKRLRCTLQNGLAWCTEKKYMRYLLWNRPHTY